jgi:hypothetical protein
MSVGSVVPFTRFAEYRRRRLLVTAANDAADIVASIDAGNGRDTKEIGTAGGVSPPSTPGRLRRVELGEGDVDGEFGEDARI